MSNHVGSSRIFTVSVLSCTLGSTTEFRFGQKAHAYIWPMIGDTQQCVIFMRWAPNVSMFGSCVMGQCSSVNTVLVIWRKLEKGVTAVLCRIFVPFRPAVGDTVAGLFTCLFHSSHWQAGMSLVICQHLTTLGWTTGEWILCPSSRYSSLWVRRRCPCCTLLASWEDRASSL